MNLLQTINPKVILCDIWGVIHDGKELFVGVLDFLNFCKTNNIKVVLFSNAPRRSEAVQNFLLEKFNLSNNCYYDLITSGEVFVKTASKDFAKNSKCFYFGEDKDTPMMTEIETIRTEEPNNADFIFIIGPYRNLNDENIDNWLLQLKQKNLIAYCPNPDLSVIQNGVEIKCAGFVAKKYQDMGGKVIWFGKPYSQMYEYAINKLGCQKSDILAIGDSLNNDIAGANNFGIKSTLVLTGKDKTAQGSKHIPDFIINNLSEFLL